jgi:hypothetical protein
MPDYKMTKELRQALLSRVPFSSKATIDYTPRFYLTKTKGVYDLPEEVRPVFNVRTMSKSDAQKAVMIKMDPNDEDSDSKLRDITRRSVVSWKRLYDAGTPDGEDLIEIKSRNGDDGYIDKDLFDTLPPYVIADIYLYIAGISGLRQLDKAGL